VRFRKYYDTMVDEMGGAHQEYGISIRDTVAVEELCYKPEGRGFKIRLGN
jgi:hypothetical protein